MKSIFSLLILLINFQLFAQPLIPTEHFTKWNQFQAVKISPSGGFIAVAMQQENGKRMIGIVDRKTMKFASTMMLENQEMPGSFFWANDDRLVAEILFLSPFKPEPYWYGQWFAMNADGSDKKIITSKREAGWPELVSILPDDDKNVMILRRDMGTTDETFPIVYKLNVYTGKATRVTRAPIRGANVLVDNDGQVRIAMGTDPADHNNYKIFYRPKNGDDWQLINNYASTAEKLYPIGFGKNSDELYLDGTTETDTASLYLYNLKTKTSERIFNDPLSDFRSIIFSQNHDLVAIETEYDKPKTHFIIKNHLISRWLFTLEEQFPQQVVEFISSSSNEAAIIVKVYSDKDPGGFYLIDTVKNTIDFLLPIKSWIKAEQMAAKQPLVFTGKDDLKVTGYITLPNTVAPPTGAPTTAATAAATEKTPATATTTEKATATTAKVPLIVNLHGGPHGVRDHWQYDDETQFLASRGYAVLQVNFRGSEGFGNQFRGAGMGQWGNDMIKDIIDATQYSIKNYPVDPQKICLMGGSYGAFAALKAAIDAPDLYDCVIAIAGVYDLIATMEDSDIADSMYGEKYLADVLGTDKKVLAEQSPINHIDKLKAPVLIIHGERDKRAPLAQAETLKQKLTQRNHPYEWLLIDFEAHGFYKPENRLKEFETIEKFLAKYLR